jgi:hypothetical protein
MAQMSMEGFVPRVLFRGIEAGYGRAGRDGLRVRVCRSVWEGAAPAISVRVESARWCDHVCCRVRGFSQFCVVRSTGVCGFSQTKVVYRRVSVAVSNNGGP